MSSRIPPTTTRSRSSNRACTTRRTATSSNSASRRSKRRTPHTPAGCSGRRRDPRLPPAEREQQLVELRELLGHPAFHSFDGRVERFLRWIEFVKHQQGLAVLLFERHGGD